jgi:hypothetical protein
MNNPAAPPIPSTVAASPNAAQPLPCKVDVATTIIAAPTDHGITCLLNFDLDYREGTGLGQGGFPFWFGWVIALEKMNEEQEPDDTLAYDDEDMSGATEVGQEALIERLKAAARKLGFTQFEVRNYSPEPRDYEIVGKGALYPAHPFSGACALRAISK